MSCLCVLVHLRLGKWGDGAVASMESVDMGARDTNIRTRSNRGFCTTWDFHLYNTKLLYFSILSLDKPSPTSQLRFSTNATDIRPWPKRPRNNGSRGERVQYYMGSAFFSQSYPPSEALNLSMFIKAGVQFG